MGEIYSGAKRTVFWLGVNPGSDELLRSAKELRFLNVWNRFPFMTRFLYSRYKTMAENMSINSFKSIMWFHRIWTIQEVALARRVRVLSLQREMDYDQFIREWMDLHWKWSYMTTRDPMADLIATRGGIRQVVERQRLSKRRGLWWWAAWEPTDFLCSVTASASSHPSDKIFAIHGLLKELGFALPDPEYSMDTGEVYWKACASLMTQASSVRSLLPLTLVNGLHWNSNIPSWVPDFNQPLGRIVRASDTFNGLLGVNLGHFRPAEFELIDNNKIIATKARINGLVRGRIYQNTELQSNRSCDVSLGVAELVREHIQAIHCL